MEKDPTKNELLPNNVLEIVYTKGEGGVEVKREKIEWGDEKSSVDYDEALKFVEEAGDDWRLPTFAEIDYAKRHDFTGLNPKAVYWFDNGDREHNQSKFDMSTGENYIDTWSDLAMVKIVRKVG